MENNITYTVCCYHRMGFNITYPGNMVCFRYITLNTQYSDHHNRYHHHYHHLDHHLLHHHHVACRVLVRINTLEVF